MLKDLEIQINPENMYDYYISSYVKTKTRMTTSISSEVQKIIDRKTDMDI